MGIKETSLDAGSNDGHQLPRSSEVMFGERPCLKSRDPCYIDVTFEKIVEGCLMHLREIHEGSVTLLRGTDELKMECVRVLTNLFEEHPEESDALEAMGSTQEPEFWVRAGGAVVVEPLHG